MTPFDPIALVAMLLAFYPVVSGSALARARGERPEYFAAGVLFGSKGDKLRLPDGREWDLIANSGLDVSQRRWQALYIDPAAPHVDDPFALEEGPLSSLDDGVWPTRVADDTFAAIAARHLEELAGTDVVLHGAAQTIIESNGATRIESAFERQIVPAREFHEATRRALAGEELTDVLETSRGQDHTIDSGENQYDQDPPADLPDTDPGPAPFDDTPGGTPGPAPAQ